MSRSWDLRDIYNQGKVHDCQDEHKFIPKNMVKIKFNYFLLWGLGSSALWATAMYDSPWPTGYQLTYFTLLLHALVFLFLTLMIWLRVPWNPLFSSMIAALWILSSFVLLGVIVIAIASPDLVNETADDQCSGLGTTISSQFSIHVLPLVSLSTITGFPSELRPSVPSLWASALIFIYLAILTIAQQSFIIIYKVKYVTDALAVVAAVYVVVCVCLECLFRYCRNTRFNMEIYVPF